MNKKTEIGLDYYIESLIEEYPGGENADLRLDKAYEHVGKNYPGASLTLEQLGQLMGITRERVRQIEHKALKKMRHPCRSSLLNQEN